MGHLPGQTVSVQDDGWGTKCDEHPEVDAVKRICTESDSFGSEYANLCQACVEEHEQAIKEKESDPSQWARCKCGNEEPRLISYRDPDEGMHGPVYEHCSKCHEKMNAAIAKELEEAEEYDTYQDDMHDYVDVCDSEPHYEDMYPDELQSICKDINEEWKLPFVIDDKELRLVVVGTKKYNRFNKRFWAFIESETDNGTFTHASCKGCDVEINFTSKRTSDRKIEYRKAQKPKNVFDFVKLVKEGMRRRPSRNTTRHYVTPVYTITVSLHKVYY